KENGSRAGDRGPEISTKIRLTCWRQMSRKFKNTACARDRCPEIQKYGSHAGDRCPEIQKYGLYARDRCPEIQKIWLAC
ncbi:11416_t:CDS:1, partial [Cetraspora pellucida]